MISKKAEETIKQVRALRLLTEKSGTNTISAQDRLLRRLSQQDLTDVAKALAEKEQS